MDCNGETRQCPDRSSAAFTIVTAHIILYVLRDTINRLVVASDYMTGASAKLNTSAKPVNLQTGGTVLLDI